MAWSTLFFPLILLFSLTSDISTLCESSSTAPLAFVLPVSKHPINLQHTTIIYKGTPLVPVNVAIDLGGAFFWVTCSSATYGSSTYTSPLCNSPECFLAQHPNKPRTKCSNNTCIVYSKIMLTSKVLPMKLSEDVLTLQSTNGANPTSMVYIPQFLYLCASIIQSKGLPVGSQGVASLGHGTLGLLSQLSMKLNIKRKFSLCFSPSPNAFGVLFIGDGTNEFSPGIDVSKILIFTPLILKPKRINSPNLFDSYEYYIKINSIKVNGISTPLTSSLLAKISTIYPYTVLETSIYDSLTRAFIEEAMLQNISKVAPKVPLDICFSTKNNNGERMRLSMPVIDLVLQDVEVFWRVFGLNSMVEMGTDVMCLAFLDGGLNPKDTIAIGSLLLEDNFLQFDLVSSRLGFTNSLLLKETSCARFNFTAIL